jgi:hypothetical protein
MSDLTDIQDIVVTQAINSFYSGIDVNVLYSGNIFPSDNEITGLPAGKHLLAFGDLIAYFGDLPAGFYMMDNSYPATPVTLTKDDFKAISASISELYYACIQNYNQHYQNIYALLTVPDVEAYNYTTGYPTLPYALYTTFQVSYSAIINADYAIGSLVGAPVGSAVITNGYLNLSFDDGSYADYSAVDNADEQQIGTIQFTVKPNYDGSPTSGQTFISISKADEDSTNLIQLTHKNTTGNLELTIKDDTDSTIVSGSLGTWVPVSGTDYIFRVHFDITAGSNSVFIDGVQFGSTNIGTGVRDSSIGLFRAGNNYDSTAPSNSNMKIKNLSIVGSDPLA